jgi:hypothetical protein
MANNINDPEKYVSATATVAGVVFSFAFAFFKSWAYEPGEWSDKPICDHLYRQVSGCLLLPPQYFLYCILMSAYISGCVQAGG